MKKYTTILFDLDGTLTDSALGITNCVKYALEQMHRDVLPQSELLKFIGPPLYESFARFCNMNPEDVEEAVRLYRVRYADVGLFENEVYAGVPEMLERLKKSGRTLAVATSKPEIFARRILAHFELDGYFDFIGGAGIGERNAKSEVIEYTLENLGAKNRADVLMVGDRKHDIDGAHSLDIDCLAVLYGYGNRDEFELHGAQYIADTPQETADMIINTDK
jgi:phosphoglycolate phosphatase